MTEKKQKGTLQVSHGLKLHRDELAGTWLVP